MLAAVGPMLQVMRIGPIGRPVATWEPATFISEHQRFALRAADRGARDPLVVIGGAITFVNPEPLAPFADVIAAGEGEELVPKLVDGFRQGGSRDDLLKSLARQRGFYIPSFYDVEYRPDGTIERFVSRKGTDPPQAVKKAALAATDAVEPPCTQIFTPDTEFGSRFLIEVVRGCANLCRFCWAGYNYLPVRAFPADRILARARAARPHSSHAGLVSIALCDHPDIERILSGLAEMGYSISPASLRLDLLFGDRESETGAAETVDDRGVCLSEALEYPRLRLGRDADAGIGDFET